MANDNTKLIILLEAQSHKLQNSLVQVNKQIDRFAVQTERRFLQMQQRSTASFAKISSELRSSVGGMGNLLAPLTAALSFREVIHYADAWQTAGNKIAAAGQVAGLVPRSLDELKDSANGARQSFSEYVDLYSRLLRTAPSVAASELEVARATDIVAKSLKAGGASAQEQQAALIQLGQALGSGILAGDELRSIRENAPLIARALAKEFGVTIGQLKALGAEGKLTSDRVFKAILAGGEDIEAAFNKTRSTIGDAFTRIQNNFTQYIGTAGKASGATQALIDSLIYLADHFAEAGNAVVIFAGILATALAGKAIAGVIVGLTEAVVALATFMTAMSTGALTIGIVTAAMAPLMIILAAAAVAIGVVVYQQGEAARVAGVHSAALDLNAVSLEVAVDASDKFRESLKSTLEVQLAAAKVALEYSKAQIAAARANLSFQMTVANAKHGLATPAGSADNAPVFGSDVLDENQKFVDKLQAQVDTVNKIMLTPGDNSGEGIGGSGGGKAAEKFKKKTDAVIDATEAILAQTEAQRTLNPLINDYGYAVEFAKQKIDLLQAAHDAGLKDNPDLLKAINFLAAGYATAATEAKKLAETQDEIRAKVVDTFSSMKDVTKGFIQDLIAGKSAAESLGNALSNVGDRLLNMGLDALFGTGSGSNAFGVIGKLFGLAKGGIVANGKPKMFANGGVSRTAAVFGEAGPEAAVPLPDGKRIPVDLRMPKGGGGGGPNITYAPVIDARGADQAAVDRLERVLAKQSAEFESKVIGTVRNAKSRRAL